ncbi:uncharacterized protein ARMOST_04363 [Armillaria ostoyae]|uniref:Uncharacterized protein n=1 Tax=Armillaria ostoyae TaxID=47428 RepID=A0A284QX59_ARMOS|nr:uncharacterized protein ARMOST_04363 [Armillaria ostoyae]
MHLKSPLAVPGPRCCVASRDVTERKGSHVTSVLVLFPSALPCPAPSHHVFSALLWGSTFNLHIQLMGLDAPLLQLLAPCTDSRTSPRRFSHDDYSVITKAASPTILTCTRRDATYKAGPSQFYRILPFSPPSTVERARLREDTEGFRTARMMLQVLYALLLQSLSSEHPGAIIESSSHFGTNEALMWRDHEFHVLPNPDDPHSPIILIRIKIHLLKGYRKNNATYKEFLLMPETHSCPLPRFPHRRHGHRGQHLSSHQDSQ